MKFERTEWIGHATARRKLTEDGWLYEDDRNQDYALLALFKGVCLTRLDEFIERLEAEGAGAGRELRERRLQAYEERANGEAFKRHLEWLINRKREIETAEAAQAEINRLRAANAALSLSPSKSVPALNFPAASPAAAETDPERRLRRLRELGGNMRWHGGRWTIKGRTALVKQEKAEGRRRIDPKTISKDLREAAEAEKREGQPSASFFPR